MNKKIATLFLLGIILFIPKSVYADEAAKALPWQIADALTTRMVLSKPCGYERDPLVRPFTKSDVGAIVGAVGTNLLLRHFAHKNSTFHIVIGTEALMTANNLNTYEREGYKTADGWYCK